MGCLIVFDVDLFHLIKVLMLMLKMANAFLVHFTGLIFKLQRYRFESSHGSILDIVAVYPIHDTVTQRLRADVWQQKQEAASEYCHSNDRRSRCSIR